MSIQSKKIRDFRRWRNSLTWTCCHHPTIRNPKVWSPIFANPWSEKMRSPNYSVPSPLTGDLPGLVLLNCRMGCIHHLPSNVQVCCPLLALRGGHVVVLQMKIPQVTLVRHLIDNVAESFTFWLSYQHRLIAHASSLTLLVPVWQLGRLPPSMQCKSLCRTTQTLASRNRQSKDWQTKPLFAGLATPFFIGCF